MRAALAVVPKRQFDVAMKLLPVTVTTVPPADAHRGLQMRDGHSNVVGVCD